MTASKRSDQIFQLSLTEIAFTISFILLLLLGYLVMRESEARKAAQEKLAQLQGIEAAEQLLNGAKQRFQVALTAAGAANPDEVVTKLLADAKPAAERDQLLIRVKDLEAQVSTLTEVKQILANAGKEAGQKAVAERINTAMALQADAEKAIEAVREAAQDPQVRPAASAPAAASSVPSTTVSSVPGSGRPPTDVKPPGAARQVAKPSSENVRQEVRRAIELAAAVNRAMKEAGAQPLPPGREAQTIADMVKVAEGVREIERSGKAVNAVLKENADLRGQMVSLQSKMRGAGRGVDHVPCWPNEAGDPEFLFTVDLQPNTVIVTKAWPESRSADAAALPGAAQLLAGPVSYDAFRAASRPIFDLSKKQVPECRHFVNIRNTIETRQEADRARWMVEEFFYKREVRR